MQVEDENGGVLDFDMQEGVQNAIFNEVYQKWYNLVEEVLICKDTLRGQFGYMSTLPTAWLVLEGSYDFPLDIDESTKELLKNVQRSNQLSQPTQSQVSSPENNGSSAGKG